MYTVKMKGKTVEEAIKSALEVLKIPRESAEIRIISEGETGVLGVFGGKDAEVEVKAKLDPAEAAKSFLQGCLDRMGYFSQIYVEKADDQYICIDIKGDDISRIIGKDGHSLEALQYLANIAVNKGAENRKRIIVDAGGYRVKQEKRVERIAKETAEEVLVSGKEVELPPMNARERRIIHMAIKEIKGVSSQSIGERSDRRVVIAPQK